MLIGRPQFESRELPRRGFTLVEMLVAVALILLMMTMFAEIFTLATGTMSKQKGLSELDQRQRSVSTLLRNDLQNRTFRNVFPFLSGDSTTHVYDAQNRATNIPFDLRQGYFYISENDPDRDDDDVLQFTVTRLDGSLFYGKTKELLDQGYPANTPALPQRGAGYNPNQPETDDGDYYADGYGTETSPSAEVSYFVRNGVLYRRVLLIRQPADPSYDDNPMSSEPPEWNPPLPPLPAPQVPPAFVSQALIQPGIYPQASGGNIYVLGGTLNDRYPQDFDCAATNDLAANPSLIILGHGDLANLVNAPNSMGHPTKRFGFTPLGRPLEFVSNGFIGRYTHEETSHKKFGWPGDPGYGGDQTIGTGDDTNPYTTVQILDANFAVSQYANSDPLSAPKCRQGEDILLTNVQSFDIKVWDPAASVGPDAVPGVPGRDDDNGDMDFNVSTGADNSNAELGYPGGDDGAWVDIGHNGIGFYSQTQNKNSNWGPSANNNRCFDTWHADPNLTTTLGPAPFRPCLPGADGGYGRANYDDDNGDMDNDTTTGADDIAEMGWPNTDDVPILLKAIQIRIRYQDLSSGLTRDVTIIEFLRPTEI